MRISDWSSDVCSSDLRFADRVVITRTAVVAFIGGPGALAAAIGAAQLARAAVVPIVASIWLLAAGFSSATMFLHRKSTRLNSSHQCATRLPASACNTQEKHIALYAVTNLHT